MLSVGKAESERAQLKNMSFILGDAAELPFLECSFDIVLSRLAFLHFTDPERPFSEMARGAETRRQACADRHGGSEEDLRKKRIKIEKLRGPSRVKSLSKEEMLCLYREHRLSISCCETVRMPTILQNWLDHTETPSDIQEQIKTKMQQEISGGSKTGFDPYYHSS